MQLHKFADYDSYLAAERAGSRYRMNRGANAIEEETGRIVAYFHANRDRSPMKCLCHGARAGVEVRQFQKFIPKDAEVLGTDVFAKDPTCVIEWDYHKTKPEWERAFDLVYSNSLDHSPSPRECLATWLGQLKPDGMLFLVWTFAHTLEERPLPYPGGDCFGAGLHEYIRLVQLAGGEVLDLLWCPVERLNDHVVIVAGRSMVKQ
jgi:hypothetical protein